MAFLFDRLKIVRSRAAPSRSRHCSPDAIETRGGRVGVIVSGGNVGVARFAELLGG